MEEPGELGLRGLRKSSRERIARFDGLPLSDVPRGRQALRKFIPERIAFIPGRSGVRRYHLRWAISAKSLIEGGIPPVATPPRGIY